MEAAQKSGSGGISQTTCHSIEEVETGEETGYFLEGCNTSIRNLIYGVNKDGEFTKEFFYLIENKLALIMLTCFQ